MLRAIPAEPVALPRLASQVAERLDTQVLDLLRKVAQDKEELT